MEIEYIHVLKQDTPSDDVTKEVNVPHVREIEKFTKSSNYSIHIGWKDIEKWIRTAQRDFGMDLNPDFQRGHIWTTRQKTAYVEFILKGGLGADELKFNCTDWMRGEMKEPLVIVDGLQRLSAVREFTRGEFPAFGHKIDEWEGIGDPMRYRFTIMINDLETRHEVMKWYLELNGAGTPHTEEDLERVRQLMRKEAQETRPARVAGATTTAQSRKQ